jgi:hypothetical protein
MKKLDTFGKVLNTFENILKQLDKIGYIRKGLDIFG